jgi:hypothetical protein
MILLEGKMKRGAWIAPFQMCSDQREKKKLALSMDKGIDEP